MDNAVKYQDFEIELGQCCCKKPEIRVLESPYDRPRARFTLETKEKTAADALVREFESLLLRGDKHASRRRQLAQEIGTALYKTLFSGVIGRSFEKCVAALGHRQGLRIRLSFGQPYNHALGSLPWELLYDPATHRFIGCEQQTPIARYLDLPDKIAPLDVAPPLKILGLVASPNPETSRTYSYSKLDKTFHRGVLKDAIGPAQYLQLRTLKGSTLESLHSELIDAEEHGTPYHALHILCHGGFDLEGSGALFLEREDGREHLVSGNDLARQISRSVRLVTLASCSTACVPTAESTGHHPFAGVASALVARSVPAVVAMQFTISEDAAVSFTKGYYRALDRNKSIDDAVIEGRLAIDRNGASGELERATPVLFLRSPDGKVLNLVNRTAPAKKVAIFNVHDRGYFAVEQSDYEIDLEEYFDGRFVYDRANWNGPILDALRNTLTVQLPQTNPCEFAITAPLSIGFAAGFLLPANDWRDITIIQSGNRWKLNESKPANAPTWLAPDATSARIPSEFPLDSSSDDIALVVEMSRSSLGHVATYLQRSDLAPPRVRKVVYGCFESPDQAGVLSGGHARALAEKLIARVENLANRGGKVHIFLAGPIGLSFALGRLSRTLGTVQLYEFDFERKRHKSYEPSITLVSPEMGGTA